MSAIQTDFLTVPYKGTGPAMNDLLGGQVDFMCDQTTNTTSQIKAGKVKAYGVTSPKRVPSLPDIPTLDEQGLKGFEVGIWHGLYAPKGTPKPVLDKLVAALQAAMKDPTRADSASPSSARRPIRRTRRRPPRCRRTSRPRSTSGARSSRRRACTPTTIFSLTKKPPTGGFLFGGFFLDSTGVRAKNGLAVPLRTNVFQGRFHEEIRNNCRCRAVSAARAAFAQVNNVGSCGWGSKLSTASPASCRRGWRAHQRLLLQSDLRRDLRHLGLHAGRHRKARPGRPRCSSTATGAPGARHRSAAAALDSLAHLLGVEAAGPRRLQPRARDNMQRIFPTARRSPKISWRCCVTC